MRAESNLLSRRNAFQLSSSSLTAAQLGLDSTSHSFTEHAADPYTLSSIFLGGAAFRAVRGLSFSTFGSIVGESRVAASLLKTGSNALGLFAESGTFVSSERLLRVAFANADTSTLEWSGREGIRNAWASAAVNFTALRGAGVLTAQHNALIQHFASVNAMVGANQASAQIGFTDAPTGSLMEQFAQASIMDLQVRSGMALMHHFAPGIAAWERNLDVTHQVRQASLAGSASEALRLNNPLMSMRAEGEGGSKTAPQGTRAEQALARDVESFVRDVVSDERIPAERRDEVIRVLGAEEGIEHHARPAEDILSSISPNRETLNHAKQVRDDILSDTHIPNEKIEFGRARHLVPNGVSLLACVFGMLSVYASHDGRFHTAAYLLVAAAVADKMDGFFARKELYRNPADPQGKRIDAKHPIGNFLDSMVDVSVYGVATGYFIYSVCSYLGVPEIGATIGVIGSSFAALRLAIFEHVGTPAGQKILPTHDIWGNPVHGNGHGFMGRPSTLTAPEVAVLWLAAGNNHEFFLNHPYAFAIPALISSLAMMGPFAYRKLTDGGLGAAFRSKAFVGSIVAGAGLSIYRGDPQPLALYSLLWLGAYLYSPAIETVSRRWRRRGGVDTTGVRVVNSGDQTETAEQGRREGEGHEEADGEIAPAVTEEGPQGRRRQDNEE